MLGILLEIKGLTTKNEYSPAGGEPFKATNI
jgi:hypothetical protein